MHEQLSGVGLLTHGLAAFGFLALAAILLIRREQTASSLWLVVAATATALWNIANLTSDMMLHERAAIVSLMETVRTAAWIIFLASLLVRFWRVSEQISHSFLWAVALSFIFAFQILADGAHLAGLTQTWAQSYPLISPLFLVGRLACAIGGLVLLHNVYVNANPLHRWGIRSLCIGVGGLFAYDLNLYTLTILNGSPGEALIDARGMVNLLVVPLIILSARRNRLWKLDIQVSRQVVFQSLSLIGIGGYFIAMSLASYGLRLIGGSIGGLLQVSFLFACVMMGIVVMSSGRFRAWAKVKINKHFFAYKYDYREEWLRFIATLSGSAAEPSSLHARVIQAVCDIVDSPGGALWLPDETGAFGLASRWNFRTVRSGAEPADGPLIAYVNQRQRIVNFEELREGEGDYGGLTVPDWAGPGSRVWLGVPLIHLERLAGLLIIETPRTPRTLNWEDFDLLRTVGRQAASYLAEQAAEAALMEARKFEEFNRRFAFIMHDIKNLVSQLSLVARNAERHADNPEFQHDMMLTIKSSVDKMNDLLARLKQHNIQRSDSEAVDLTALLRRMVAARAHAYPGLALDAGDTVLVRAHAAKLEQVFGHLIQNAIEASCDGQAIRVALHNGGDAARIEVMDGGVGMSEEFIRNDLFTPFRSTKPGGFGIGAYEAREIVKGYGGRIEVLSREGEGSVFTVVLPVALQEAQA